MKKKWIAAFIAAGVLLLGGVTVYAVKTSSQSTVKVVSVSDMSGGGGWSDNSLSGKYYFRCIAEYLSGRFTESKENIM